MAFDVAGARKAGYSDSEIADFLSTGGGFDTKAAREAGYSDTDIVAHLTKPIERGTGEQIQRGVGLFGKGMNDAIGAGIGALPDAVGWGLRQIGLPSSRPGQYTEMAQGALNALGRNDTPENTTEKFAYGAGQGVGNAASVMAPGAAMARMAPAGSVARGVGQTLSSQPVMQAVSGAVGGGVGEATDNPLLGMGASMAVPAATALARGLLSPGAMQANPELQRLTQVAQQEGIPLTSGQATGSRPMRALESVFATLPSTAGRQERVTQAQREAFNAASLGKMGVRGEKLALPSVVTQGLDDAGQRMQAVYSKHDWIADTPTMKTVLDVSREAKRELPKDVARPILNRIEDLIDKVAPNGGTFTVDGKTFGNLDSAISRELRTATDGKVVDYMGRLQGALRDAYAKGIADPGDAADLAEARRQYANGMVILKAMNSPSASTAAGNIPPAALSQALAAGPRKNYARGFGDLNDLTRVGRAFVQDTVPNSGTPERNYMINLLTGGGAAGGAMAAGGNIGTAALTAAATLGGPRVMQEAYLSAPVQAYMRNQLANRLIDPVQMQTIQSIAAAQAKSMLDREKKE